MVVAGTSGERGTLVSAVRRDPELSTAVSTVDHVGTPQGTLVAAWAVADLFDGSVGHYGTGPGADPLPDPSASPDPTASAQPSVTARPSVTPSRQSGAVG